MEDKGKNCFKIYSDILQNFDKNQNVESNHSLFIGSWGALLYLFYYEQFCDPSLDNSTKYLQELYQNLDKNFDQNYSYCSGLSGPFWLLHHLNKYDFIELDIDHLASDFIFGAIAQSNYFISELNFDFLHGSAGICNLLAEFTERKEVRFHLSFFVNSLMSSSVKTDMGLSFPFFYYHSDPASKPGVDAFSLAHGTCSLQIILLRIHHVGIEKELCEHLIKQSMEFILNHENEGDKDSLFPTCLDGKSISSRVSWCYGDLNVAISLWQCGQYFQIQKWMDKAIAIFKFNINRIIPEASGAVDACLCHGAAGNAAMYMRMWRETREQSFLNCANEWYKNTEAMLKFSDDINTPGILVYQGKDDQWQYRWDLLEGSAGVGLALISKQVGKPLPWDEFMLLS
jgi:lantibiotic biosynthesis protein